MSPLMHEPSNDGMTGRPLPADIIGPNPISLVKSGARVLEIFEFFYRAQRPARGVEIAEALNLPKSSSNGLLKMLVEAGYLTFNDRRKTYFPSFRIVRFGNWLASFYFGGNLVLDLMSDLQHRTGECVALTVQNDRYMQFLAMLPAPGLTKVFQEGMKTPLIGSASGGALLTTMADQYVIDITRRCSRVKLAAKRERECQFVLGKVRQFRKQGYAVSYRPVVPDTRTVAIALPPGAGNVTMVLSLGGPSSHLETHEGEIAAIMHARTAHYLNT